MTPNNTYLMNNNPKPTNTKDAKPKFANLDMDKFKFDFRLFFPQNSEDNFSNTLEK
tara:strand:+ start:2549 stop:2716 length:168 start_codon:yes stop_codon:yes gene_type:complete